MQYNNSTNTNMKTKSNTKSGTKGNSKRDTKGNTKSNTKSNSMRNTRRITKKGKRKVKRIIKLTLQSILLLILLGMAGGIFYFYFAYGKTILQLQSDARQMVNTSTPDTFKANQTSLVYDADGNLISTLKAEKDVYYLEYQDIPTTAIDAMVVTEDRKFLEHDGVDYLANIRAAISLIKNKGKIKQGASTITQQLARNVFLTQEVTYTRKIEEIFVAQEIEKKYNKFDIMEYYINNIYFANGHYGIQAAANGYFGESAANLSLSQIAFLCAIPNSPNRYNPITNMNNTMKRRDRILEQLRTEDKISESQYQEAISEPINLNLTKSERRNYVETYMLYSAVKALMKNRGFEFRYQFDSNEDKEAYEEAYNDLYNSCQKELYVSGYRIYTSIDMNKQDLLQKSVDDALLRFDSKNEDGIYQMQGAAVSIDNDSGKVVAIVGGRDQNLGGYTLNRAFQSYRQPGSAIKPLIVYTPSFERNYTPASTVVDERIEGGPKNSGGRYDGEMKLQRAIELSKNTIAWKLFEELTPRVGLSYLQSMNFARITKDDYGLASALGGFTFGVSPVEMAAAFATLENDGYYREPTCIVKIMDTEGNEIIGDTTKRKAIYQTNAARIMTEALTGVIKNGTGKGLGLKNTISAGKTGTTNNKKDGWFVGYTPYYTTSVWVGYDMPRAVNDLTGASYPGTIWHNYMNQIHNSSMKHTFQYYDWRAVLKKQQEEKDRLEQEAKDQEEQDASEVVDPTEPAATPTTAPEDGSQVDGDDTNGDNTVGDGGTAGEDGTDTSNNTPGDNVIEGDENDSTVGEEYPNENDDTSGVEQGNGSDSGNNNGNASDPVTQGTNLNQPGSNISNSNP
jgi:penicillin-binding protein 4